MKKSELIQTLIKIAEESNAHTTITMDYTEYLKELRIAVLKGDYEIK